MSDFIYYLLDITERLVFFFHDIYVYGNDFELLAYSGFWFVCICLLMTFGFLLYMIPTAFKYLANCFRKVL